jgi:hypothetical protein
MAARSSQIPGPFGEANDDRRRHGAAKGRGNVRGGGALSRHFLPDEAAFPERSDSKWKLPGCLVPKFQRNRGKTELYGKMQPSREGAALWRWGCFRRAWSNVSFDWTRLWPCRPEFSPHQVPVSPGQSLNCCAICSPRCPFNIPCQPPGQIGLREDCDAGLEVA